MKEKNTIQTLMSLSKREADILEVLEKEGVSRNISQIADCLQVSRTSLYTPINKLVGRRLIARRKHGRETKIRLRQDVYDQIRKKGDQSLSIMGEVRSFRGAHEVMDFFRRLIQNNKKHRIAAIQSTETIREINRHGLLEQFVEINEGLKKNSIIIEGVLCEDIFSVYSGLLQGIDEAKHKMLKSFEGRAAETIFIKKEYLKTPVDIYVVQDMLVIMNWKDLEFVEIHNKLTAKLFYELIQVIKLSGARVSFNKQLAEGWN